MLKEAGFEGGFTVTLSATDTECAQKLKHDLAEAGINLEILLGDSKQVLTRLRSREHEMALSTAGMDPLGLDIGESTFLYNPDNSDASPHKTFAWRSKWDVGPDLNERAAKARFIQEPKARAAEYEALQALFLKNAPLLVLVQENEMVAVRDNVEGLIYDETTGTFLYRQTRKK